MSQLSLFPRHQDHLAIMNGPYLDMILDGIKTIESRWYTNKIDPWENISANDTVYFKKTAKDVTVRANVEKALFIKYNGDRTKGMDVINKYGKLIGIDEKYYDQNCKDKNYCIIVFLKDVQKIEPFKINKDGYGNGSAWITMNNIDKIRKVA